MKDYRKNKYDDEAFTSEIIHIIDEVDLSIATEKDEIEVESTKKEQSSNCNMDMGTE